MSPVITAQGRAGHRGADTATGFRSGSDSASSLCSQHPSSAHDSPCVQEGGSESSSPFPQQGQQQITETRENESPTFPSTDQRRGLERQPEVFFKTEI